jgi:FkbM family methyltransferase
VEKLVQLLRAGTFSPFSFCQIGGFDGHTGDPIYNIVTSFNLPGVIAEPQPTPFAALQHTYRNHPQVVLKNAAVDWTAGSRTMYVVEPGHEQHPWVYQLASFRKEVLLHHCQTLPALAGWVQEVQLPCLTFQDLLDSAGLREIGLLQIDTEGYDYEILKMALEGGHRPTFIHYEHFHLTPEDREASKTTLKSLGYSLQQGHMDILAVRE